MPVLCTIGLILIGVGVCSFLVSHFSGGWCSGNFAQLSTCALLQFAGVTLFIIGLVLCIICGFIELGATV